MPASVVIGGGFSFRCPVLPDLPLKSTTQKEFPDSRLPFLQVWQKGQPAKFSCSSTGIFLHLYVRYDTNRHEQDLSSVACITASIQLCVALPGGHRMVFDPTYKRQVRCAPGVLCRSQCHNSKSSTALLVLNANDYQVHRDYRAPGT
jgi:hypothetical protein